MLRIHSCLPPPAGQPANKSKVYWVQTTLTGGEIPADDLSLTIVIINILILVPKPGLCPPLLNGNYETEFWVKEEKKKIALLLCQAKGPQQANALRVCPLWKG